MRLGKQPFKASPHDLLLTSFADVDALLPKVPSSFGHELGVASWGMLGNDAFGDCTCAGACHEHMDIAHGQRKTLAFTDQDALDLYTAVTGFSASDPATDQGAQVRDVLSYRRKTGVKDASGKMHKIDGYLRLEPGNIQHVLVAAYIFEVVGIGFMFPSYAMQQFNHSLPWSYRGGYAAPDEGHYVPIVGRRAARLQTVTWGKVQPMTSGFFGHYCDEAWAVYSRELLNEKGKTPEGFDRVALDKWIARL